MEGISTLVRRAAITTADLTNGGLLLPEQVAAYYDKPSDQAVLFPLVQKVGRRARTGEWNTRYMAGRQRRAATEAADGGFRSTPDLGRVQYSLVKSYSALEITNDSDDFDIEGNQFSTNLFSELSAVGQRDEEDLMINGDDTSADPFLVINDGLLTIAAATAAADINNVDCSVINAGDVDEEMLIRICDALPDRYVNNNLVWLMSKRQQNKMANELSKRATDLGDMKVRMNPAGSFAPLGYPIVVSPFWPNDQIWLVDPKMFVFFYGQMRQRIVDEGMEAASRDVKAMFLYFQTDFNILDTKGIARGHTVTATW